MAKQSKEQQEIVSRVMHEFKQGDLETSHGSKVKNPKQAVAIALHEAGASNQESPEKNKQALHRTRVREGRTEPTRAELYKEAQERDISGRSRMSKAELQKVIKG